MGVAALRAVYRGFSGFCRLIRFDKRSTGLSDRPAGGVRVAALAVAREILVLQTVKDLVAGSGLGFAPRGAHTLKGVPGDWLLFAVTGA